MRENENEVNEIQSSTIHRIVYNLIERKKSDEKKLHFFSSMLGYNNVYDSQGNNTTNQPTNEPKANYLNQMRTQLLTV